MEIAGNILKNMYFITGTAYAGKSTTVKMLARRYDMILCGENYHSAVSDTVASPEAQPDICYLRSLTGWKDFVTRSPEEYERWIYSTGREAAGFEVAELISLSRDRKVIVDTNIPLDILKEISDHSRVAVMLSPLYESRLQLLKPTLFFVSIFSLNSFSALAAIRSSAVRIILVLPESEQRRAPLDQVRS